MTSPIIYEKQNLGHISQQRNHKGELELALVFEDPKSAAIFFKLDDEAILDVGDTLLKVTQFKGMYLSRITEIYSSQREYERKNIGGLDTNNG